MNRLTGNHALTLAGRAIGKIDRDGRRGLTMVTYDEVEAMAALLALHGVPALAANEVVTDRQTPPETPPEGVAK